MDADKAIAALCEQEAEDLLAKIEAVGRREVDACMAGQRAYPTVREIFDIALAEHIAPAEAES